MDSGKKKLLSRLIASEEIVVERMDVKRSRRESLLHKGGKNSHFGLASRRCNASHVVIRNTIPSTHHPRD